MSTSSSVRAREHAMIKTNRSGTRRQHIVLMAAALAASSLAIPGADAATVTWDGGAAEDANWGRPFNWDPNAVPSPNDSLVFAGFTRVTTNNDLTAAIAYNGITFNPTAGAFTLA